MCNISPTALNFHSIKVWNPANATRIMDKSQLDFDLTLPVMQNLESFRRKVLASLPFDGR